MTIKSSDVWELKAKKKDLEKGAEYAAKTLPWTFNRMMHNTGSPGQQERGLNIAKGIVAQEIVVRALKSRGKNIITQKKSHRDDDLFDLKLKLNGKVVHFDFKSISHYSNYSDMGRSTISSKLIVKSANYPGPDWRKFFPMLIPHTQINQDKDAYCFAIASSPDPRSNPLENRVSTVLTAFPYGEPLNFLSFKKLCKEREEAGKGFFLELKYLPAPLISFPGLNLKLIGEWAGKEIKKEIKIGSGEVVENIGPFSCFSSLQISEESFKTFDGHLEISVQKNQFAKVVRNSLMRNINVKPRTPLKFTQTDFCNLILPSPYRIFILGWITKESFLKKYLQYPSWVWPLDRLDKFKNQSWTVITENDQKLLKKLSIKDRPFAKNGSIKAGLMKTTGRGSGACCYVFPNVHRRGGVSETNLYVLPKDLKPMSSLLS